MLIVEMNVGCWDRRRRGGGRLEGCLPQEKLSSVYLSPVLSKVQNSPFYCERSERGSERERERARERERERERVKERERE